MVLRKCDEFTLMVANKWNATMLEVWSNIVMFCNTIVAFYLIAFLVGFIFFIHLIWTWIRYGYWVPRVVDPLEQINRSMKLNNFYTEIIKNHSYYH